MKTLFIKLAVIGFLSVLGLLVFDAMYRQKYSVMYKRPENVLPAPSIQDKYQIVKVGNSHADDGIDFKKYNLKSLSLSGVAQKFEFDLAQLKQHRAQIAEGAVVVINVSPLSFPHTSINSQKGFQSGYYRRVSPIFIPNLNWGDYVESEFLPFVRSGYLWRQKNTDEIRERISKEEKWAEPEKKETPRPAVVQAPITGRRLVLAVTQEELPYNVEAIKAELASPSAGKDLTESVNFTFNKWYHTDEFSSEFFETNRRDLEKLIQYSLDNKWRPVLITIPISEDLQKGLLDDYMQVNLYDNLKQTDLQGVEYIDFTHDKRIAADRSLYVNSDHLSKNGAAVFSYVLLRTLIDKGYVPAEADGYDYRPLFKWIE